MSNTASLIYETGGVQVWGNAICKIVRVPLPNREREEINVAAPVSEPPPAALTEPPVSQPPEEPRSTKQLKLF